ncbi:unnamed protein product [Allacma fusca]|uniref:G-protein coupled receptors family 2 profile 2 domain-containing protein n=1 Tax=Allacma fusca TaxID=39272 RepID=A0A8J2PAD7_9HEXA|nr:unnamed protein product [Allacma fusca]
MYSSITMKSLRKEPIYFIHNPMNRCDRNATLHLNDKFCFRVQEDGNLWYQDRIFNWVKISRENYCIDTVRLLDSSNRKSMVDISKDSQIYGFVTCTPLYEYAYLGEVISILFGTGFIVGSAFLFLTFLAYAVLWKEQTIQGWIVMSHTATMFFWYFLLGVSILSDPKMPNRYLRSKLCVTFGILQHFFALSNFCWLAVISFNLFWSFRSMNAPKPRAKNIGQYMVCVAFGWGMPFLFVLASAILDLLYSYEPCNMVVVPEYGFEICFVSPSALGPYLYYPVAGVMSLNFIFFFVTACKLCEYKRRSTMTGKTLKTKTELFQLIGKLFFLTGFTWILDFATWIHSRLTGDSTGIPWYSGIVNFISVLQVVPICIIYISRPVLLSSLKTKFPGIANILSIVEKYATCSCLGCGSCAGKKSTTWLEASSKDDERSNLHLNKCQADATHNQLN